MNTAPSTDWQSWAALAVVALTALAFIVRFYLRKKKLPSSGCASGCGCAKPSLDSAEKRSLPDFSARRRPNPPTSAE